MREMKDSGISWINEIPRNWNVEPIKYSYRLIAGATPESTNVDFWDGDIKWITPADFKTKDVFVMGGSRNLTIEGYKSCSTSILPIGSIVFSKRAPIGTVAITADKLCTNQGCLGLVEKSGRVLNKFYFYVISIYGEVFNLYGSGTTFKEISANIFANIKLPMPPIQEQKRIVGFLDAKCAEIDALTADIQTQIDTLEQYKRSVITEAVSKGLNPDAEMKDSGIQWIGNMPSHWEVIRGKYILRYMQKLVRDDDGVITCFRDGEVTLRSNRREDGFTMSDKEIGYQGIDIGDLVVHGMDGFAGAIGISDSRGKASPVLNVLDTNQNKRYIMYYLRSMAYSDVFLALATGIRVRSCDLRWNKLADLSYPVPPLDEQKAIVEHVDAVLVKVDAVISDKKAQLATLDEYKKSLIFEYVTGKKEVV
ncbi:EcoKI restriction-modification system protein HsdS [uncultured Clostridium sp.]|nr:EcoKI restriction-modification system protein HsdS [uncultured Clostridium sp.]